MDRAAVASPTRPPEHAAEALRAAGWTVDPQTLGNTLIGRRGRLVAYAVRIAAGVEFQIRTGTTLHGVGFDCVAAEALAIATEAAKTALVADLAVLYAKTRP